MSHVSLKFWEERWRKGQIGFHQPATDRYLAAHWRDLGVASSGRVFVPLCGKSLDLLWLRSQGHPVSGIEWSPIAVQDFCAQHGIPARRRVFPELDLYEAPDLHLWCGDFFRLTPEQLGAPVAVFDRAALISWAAALRRPYVEHMTSLTQPGVKTLLITLEYPQEQTQGPPFSVPSDEVEHLYADHHAVRELSRHDVLANDARMQARGVTHLQEVCYLLTRL